MIKSFILTCFLILWSGMAYSYNCDSDCGWEKCVRIAGKKICTSGNDPICLMAKEADCAWRHLKELLLGERDNLREEVEELDLERYDLVTGAVEETNRGLEEARSVRDSAVEELEGVQEEAADLGRQISDETQNVIKATEDLAQTDKLLTATKANLATVSDQFEKLEVSSDVIGDVTQGQRT